MPKSTALTQTFMTTLPLITISILWLSSIFQGLMDDLIDELPVEKRHLSKLIIICWIQCRIKLMGD